MRDKKFENSIMKQNYFEVKWLEESNRRWL